MMKPAEIHNPEELIEHVEDVGFLPFFANDIEGFSVEDRFGKPYGWGVAKYSTPEQLFGYEFVTDAYQLEPEESRKRICEHLAGRLAGVTEKQILKLIG